MGFPLFVKMTDVPDAGAIHEAIVRARAHVGRFGHVIDGCEVVVWAERRPAARPRFGVQIYLAASNRDFFVNRSPAEEDAGACLDGAFASMRGELESWWVKTGRSASSTCAERSPV